MKEFIVKSAGDFLDRAFTETIYGDFFRGVGDFDSHALIPSVGRKMLIHESEGESRTKFLTRESDAFRIFKLEGRSVIDFEPCDDWEWLGIMQHHGLPTRLLDWTFSASVALYFACISNLDKDGAIYVLSREVGCLTESEIKKSHPLTYSKFTSYLPRHISPRVRAQSGIFTFHPDPTVAPPAHRLKMKFRVPAKDKDNLRRALNRAGINEKVLFPDAVGLARWISVMKFSQKS